MKVILAVILLMYCIIQSSGYFFPICTSKDAKSCTNYFSLPSISFPYLNFGNEEHEKMPQRAEEPTPQKRVVFENFDKIATSIVVYYTENIQSVVIPILSTLSQYMILLKEQCILFLPYVPFLHYEKKVKADSRLYLIFIATTLGVYLVLYVYFTKKLCSYYKKKLRDHYLNSVKRIFNIAKEQ